MYDVAGRVLRTVAQSPWTPEDRALMLAWREYKASLCNGCGMPRATAHHPDNEGWYSVHDDDRVTCWACTALNNVRHEEDKDPPKPVEYIAVRDDRDYLADPLPPLTA